MPATIAPVIQIRPQAPDSATQFAANLADTDLTTAARITTALLRVLGAPATPEQAAYLTGLASPWTP